MQGIKRGDKVKHTTEQQEKVNTRKAEKKLRILMNANFGYGDYHIVLSYMAMAGWKTSDMLDGIEGIMNLAAASGEDLATTSDIVTDALTAFGLTAKDSGHFADILAAASSNANTKAMDD